MTSTQAVMLAQNHEHTPINDVTQFWLFDTPLSSVMLLFLVNLYHRATKPTHTICVASAMNVS